MAERVMVLVRHGQFERAGPELKQGPRLTALGKRQALATGKHLRHYPIKRLCASPLNRARETATLMASRMPQVEVRSFRVLREVIPTPVPGIRVRNMRQQRHDADNAFERFFKLPRGVERYDCLVCHGNLIRYLLCRVLGIAGATWLKFDVCYHCAVTECRITERGNMRVCLYNDAGHLPNALRTIS